MSHQAGLHEDLMQRLPEGPEPGYDGMVIEA